MAVSGIGVYVYTHQQTKLTFHPDWTETDRRQIQEVLRFVNVVQKQTAEYEAEKFEERIRSLSWRDWPKLCVYTCKYYYKKGWGRDMYFHLNDAIVQTARTGNAAYIGKDNYTLLQFACGLGKQELACRLMDKGADVNVRNMRESEGNAEPGDAAINLLAVGIGESLDEKTTILLMEKLASHGADLNLKAGGVLYPFEGFCAIGGGHGQEEQERIVLKLIDLGANVSSPLETAGKGRSSFVYPVKRGLGKVVCRLCELGVDVNEGYDALPPLFCLNLGYNPEVQVEIARTLLDHGAQINTPLNPRSAGESGRTGQTPLIYLCTLADSPRKWDEKKKKALLDLFSLYCDRKANVNQPCEKGNTPLMYLLESDDDLEWRIALARILISHGADPSLKNSNGETAYDMIKQHKLSEKEILEKLPELRPGK